MYKKALIIVVIILVGLGVFYFFQQKTPEDKILSQLDEIKDYINKHEPQKSPIAAITVANKFTDFVSEDVVIQHQTQDIKYDFLRSKKELSYSLAMAQRMYNSVQLEYLEIQVDLLSENESTVELVAKVLVKENEKDVFEDVIPLKLHLSNIDDQWIITKAYNIDPFE